MSTLPCYHLSMTEFSREREKTLRLLICLHLLSNTCGHLESFKLSLKVCSPPISVSWIEQLYMVCKSFFGSWQQDGNRQRCGNCPLGLANSLRHVAPANWLIWVSTQWEECPPLLLVPLICIGPPCFLLYT